MSWFIECPFCHKSVFRWFYAWHESGHTERRADGQMKEHVTLEPEKRFEGSLAGVPQAYRHAKCGVTTGMPEEIIRTYLVNPLTYNDSTFCCGCGDYILSSELTWVDTNESVMNYTCRLRYGYLKEKFGIDPAGAEIIITPPAVRALQRIAAEKSFKQPYFISLGYTQEKSKLNYDLGFAQSCDTLMEEVIHAVGMDVVVQKSLKSKLMGTVIDFSERGPGGFVIARFRGWD